MHQLIADYWWVPILSVPALAILLKLGTEKAGWTDSLPASLRRKLSHFDDSFPGHWVVTVTMRDGRRFSHVVISRRFRLESEVSVPFRLRDVDDVAWEGFVNGPVGPAVQLSAGRPDTP